MNTINSDGSRDRTKQNITSGFDTPSWNGTIRAAAIQSDGKILVGGWFKSYNKTLVYGLVRLNSDGSRDTTFDIWSWFDIWVYDGYLNSRWIASIAVQADGKILVGWHFSTYKWVNIKSLIRLNRDASLDSSFIFNNDYSFWSNDVTLFWIQNDGKILVNIDKFYRLNQDWSLDTSFLGKNDTSFAWGGPSVVLVWPDWNIFIWWNFTSYKWISKAQMIRLNGTYVPELPGSLPVFLSDTQIIAYLLKTKKTVDPKWLFMGTIPLYF